MNLTSHRDRGAGPQPVRLRVAAVLCVVLMMVVGVAQAAHIHGQLLPSHATQASAQSALDGGVAEDACPLCMAMHSALPVTSFAVVSPGSRQAANPLLASSRKPRTPWHFAAFSRPPPSSAKL